MSRFEILCGQLPQNLHSTGVSIAGKGVLIVGPSGSGKSALALQLMAYGAGLISDDLCSVSRMADGRVLLARPAKAQGPLGIEARGIGILRADLAGPAKLHCVVDMSVEEAERFPPERLVTIEGDRFPCLHRVHTPAFAAMIWHFCRFGRVAPDLQ